MSSRRDIAAGEHPGHFHYLLRPLLYAAVGNSRVEATTTGGARLAVRATIACQRCRRRVQIPVRIETEAWTCERCFLSSPESPYETRAQMRSVRAFVSRLRLQDAGIGDEPRTTPIDEVEP